MWLWWSQTASEGHYGLIFLGEHALRPRMLRTIHGQTTGTNRKISNVQIINDKIGNAVIGRMEWPFSTTVLLSMFTDYSCQVWRQDPLYCKCSYCAMLLTRGFHVMLLALFPGLWLEAGYSG